MEKRGGAKRTEVRGVRKLLSMGGLLVRFPPSPLFGLPLLGVLWFVVFALRASC